MMKKQIFSLLFITALMMGCTTTTTTRLAPAVAENEVQNVSVTEGNEADVNNSVQNVSGIEEKKWRLIEVYIDGRDTRFSRRTLTEVLRDFYTMNFDAEIVSGVGAPNRYSAPYTLGNNGTISIMPMRSTQMASFLEPENLTEHDFYTYMQNAHSWRFADKNLELLSKTTNGAEVRLVFSL
jgi:heat shock protein HslJ